MEKAIGYARVSTEEQAAEGISLDVQLDRIRDYCVLNGLALTEVIVEEGVSASKPLADRPGGHQFLMLLRSEGVRHVVALKLDRLFRDAIDCLTVVRDWDQKGIALHLIDQGGQAINTRSAIGRFFLTVMAGAAEMERNLIGERTRIALQHKRKNGEVYGPEPFGFRRDEEKLVPIRTPAARNTHEERWPLGGDDGEKDPGPLGGSWMLENLEFLTPKEVAKILRVSPRTIQRWVKTGKLRAVRVGRLWRIPSTALTELLVKNTIEEGG